MRRALILAVALAALPSAAQAKLCVCLQCALGTHDHYRMPSGSMKPLIEPGDCVTVRLVTDPGAVGAGDVISYLREGDRLPLIKRVVALGGQTVALRGGALFIDGTRVPAEDAPDYRQVFEQEGPAGALPRCPGVVAVGEACAIARRTETLPNGASYDVLDLGPTPIDDFAEVMVPEGHVFVLGDNRDNSTDSRIPSPFGSGMVPLRRVIGVVESVR